MRLVKDHQICQVHTCPNTWTRHSKHIFKVSFGKQVLKLNISLTLKFTTQSPFLIKQKDALRSPQPTQNGFRMVKNPSVYILFIFRASQTRGQRLTQKVNSCQRVIFPKQWPQTDLPRREDSRTLIQNQNLITFSLSNQ